ncbi:MAG: tetratricopeptide repeat protein, partial [Flammeovirgaceae bacterium]
QTEALIYLAHIYLRLENRPFDALAYSKKLIDRYPKNSKFAELYIENLIAVKDYRQGSQLLMRQLQLDRAYYRISALFLEARIHWEQNGDAELAKASLNRCIDLVNLHRTNEEYKGKAKILIEKIDESKARL